LAVKRSGNVSQLFGKCPQDVRPAIKGKVKQQTVVPIQK
jgi:hypothetical protein